MNVGIIGVGKHSEQSHLEFLVGLENCQIAAIADLDQSRMGELSDRFELNARQTTDWEEVVGASDIGAVFIMTPDRLHTPQLVAAVAAGKHVFCDKPLADNAADYHRLDSALEEAADIGLVVTSCHPRRFDRPFVRAKELLGDMALLSETFGVDGALDLGRVTGFDFTFRYHEPTKEGLHESLMFDHLNHEVDLANYFFGMSGLQKVVKLYDSATRYGVSGIRNDGIELSFRGNRGLKSHIYQEDMRINFERGALAMDAHHGTAALDYEDKPTMQHSSAEYKTDYDERFLKTNEHFLRAIRGEEAVYLTADELRMNTLAAITLHNSDGLAKV